MARKPYIDHNQILRAAVAEIRETRRQIRRTLEELRRDPEGPAATEFDRMQRVSGEDKRKEMIAMDAGAESASTKRLMELFPRDVQVWGEETLNRFTRWREEPVCILLDMVDGTDLVEMAVDLWCSAIIVYNREEKKILGAAVGLASGEIYYAEHSAGRAYVEIEHKGTFQVYGCSGIKQLKDARVAYYGQKADNYLCVSRNAKFDKQLDGLRGSQFRLYNFGGNPMMVKLCDRVQRSDGARITGDIDAVFDVAGQHLHDALPGAFIAKQAGAYFCNLDGTVISDEAAGEMMSNPLNRIKYVLAATPELGKELAASLQP